MKRTILIALLVACSSSHGNHPDSSTGGDDAPNPKDGTSGDTPMNDGTTQGSRTIFVIPMENESANAIYGNANAPYINNTLMPMAAYATMFTDQLPSGIPSEPHYVWMEAGTNQFTDTTFTSDADASAGNSTNSTAHLVAQLDAAHIGWTSYQEGMTAGTCPISSIGGTFYAAKHDPYVFFQDVSGNPPSKTNANCIAHHKPYSAFVADLNAGTLPPYVWITPNLCHDMHGALGCPQIGTQNDIKAGDTWLSQELPRILAYAAAHNGVVYVVWDEGSNNQLIPFLALGPGVKTGASATAYTQSSQVKSIEEQLGVSVLPAVTAATDFAGMFQPGQF